ncbi:hypothetical protein [Sulfurovum sp.]|jgi:hypothetical protein|uniref:hypothetical protein n=1 Tax=Sulfurovum sp. TaxID=1969726 RepID=UPI0025DA1BE2|nr:hypothetical protein [Sulfurovum sp.]
MIGKKTILHLFLLFYILGTFASATHIHHESANIHTDCKICLLSNTMHGGNIAEEQAPALLLPAYIIEVVPPFFSHVSLISKGFHAQAPPFSSFF